MKRRLARHAKTSSDSGLQNDHHSQQCQPTQGHSQQAHFHRQPSFSIHEELFNPLSRNKISLYSHNLFSALRYRGSILPSIAPVLLFTMIESTCVTAYYKLYQGPYFMDDKLVSLIGSALAMLLAFRTNRSFERYNQGAQLWTNLAIQIRHLARFIWNSVSPQTPDDISEKNTIMRLILAAVIATKYALRGLNPYEYEDFRSLISPQLVNLSYRSSLIDIEVIEVASQDIDKPPPLSRNSSWYLDQKSSTAPSNIPLLPFDLSSSGKTSNMMNAPLDILIRISQYIRRSRNSGILESPEDYQIMNNSITQAIDSVTKFEQILYIPLPRGYDLHIKQVLMLYFLLLPFQLVKQMGWCTTLAVAVLGLAFFGTDAIGQEISDPFGTDANDLPLEYFVSKLRQDLEYIMEKPFDGLN